MKVVNNAKNYDQGITDPSDYKGPFQKVCTEGVRPRAPSFGNKAKHCLDIRFAQHRVDMIREHIPFGEIELARSTFTFIIIWNLACDPLSLNVSKVQR